MGGVVAASPGKTRCQLLISASDPTTRQSSARASTRGSSSNTSTIRDSTPTPPWPGVEGGVVESYKYKYLGLGTVIEPTQPQVGEKLTYIRQTGDSAAAGGDRYSGPTLARHLDE